MTTEPSAPTRQGEWINAGIGLLVVCVATYALTRLSLDDVPGVTRKAHGGCCETQFVNDNWWLAMGVLAVPIWWVTRLSLWAAIVAVAVPTYATFHIASTTIQRYQDTGWGDGLEVFAYLGSLLHLAIFLSAAALGASSWRRRRRRALPATEPIEP